tara:strand:+ start:67 stop:2523 length:2457 start_codon:yes stop_codon:yes gene_type:complete
MTQLVDQGPPTQLVTELPAISSQSEESAVQDVARLQEARRAFDNREITREQLIEVQNEVLAKYGSVANLERLLPREAEAPVELTSPTSALPPEPFLSVEEVPPPPPPASPEPAPQVISEQILEEKIPIAAGQRIQTAEAPTALEPVVPDPTVGEALSPTIAEQLLVEKGEAPRDLDRPLDFWQDAREYQLRHRYGATNEQINEILDVSPELTQRDLLEGNFSYSDLPLRSDEEYEASISAAGEAEETVTTVAEEAPSIPGGVHPDTLAKAISPEEYAGRSELQKREAKKIRGDFEVTTDQGPLTRYLADAGKVKSDEDTPSTVLENSIDAIIAEAVAASKGEKFNKEAFAKEIEAMLPEVEDDPETEGWLIALMGASIMAGKDPNAWVNVGAGLEKSLPALINFKLKKKEAARERKSTAAKISIETMLSRESEDRATIRNIRAVGTQAQIDLTVAALEPKDWFVAEAALIPAIAMGGSADDPALVVPRTTTLRLNDAGMQRATELGLKLLPWDSGSWTLDDLITGTPTTAETVKALNELGKETNTKVFADYVKNPMTINYTTPRSGALLEGSQVTNMININDLDAFYREYDRVRMPTKGLIKDIGVIQGLVLDNPKAFSGTGLVADQIADSLRALKGIGVAQDAVEWLEKTMGATKVLGAQQQAQTRALIVMAKIAPMLLDESGKTISDADRRMIAETLGLTVFEREDKSFSVKLDATMFRNPANIVLALNQTQVALAKRLNEVNAAGRAHLAQFGVPNIGNATQRNEYNELERRRRTLEETEETPEASGKNIFDIQETDLTFDFLTPTSGRGRGGRF